MKKDSFILYTYQAETISDLSLEQKGVLLTALFEYAAGEQPEITDQAVKVAFASIRVQIERDNKKYTDVCEKRRKAASNRWQNDAKQNKTIQNQTKRCKTIQNDAKNANAHFAYANDYDNEYDNDNELLSPNVDNNIKEPTTTSKKINLEKEIEKIKKNNQVWSEMICMKYHINQQELYSWLDKFIIHCHTRYATHNDTKDLVRHFDDWLRITLQEKRKEEKPDNKKRRANNNITTNPEEYKFDKF